MYVHEISLNKATVNVEDPNIGEVWELHTLYKIDNKLLLSMSIGFEIEFHVI